MPSSALFSLRAVSAVGSSPTIGVLASVPGLSSVFVYRLGSLLSYEVFGVGYGVVSVDLIFEVDSGVYFCGSSGWVVCFAVGIRILRLVSCRVRGALALHARGVLGLLAVGLGSL